MSTELGLVNEGAYLDGRLGLNPLDFITPQDPAILTLAQQIVAKLGDEDSSAGRLREAYNYVALNIRYVTDKQSYGYEEVWQKPSLTLKRGLGDCEDLSYALCSLLQALGVRARVVFGEWRGQGHAWVEAWIDSTGGILETTSNQPFTGYADPTDYRAEATAGAGPEDPLMAFLAYITPGFILFGLGAFLMIDDAQDAFLLRWPPHHFFWGLLLVIISIAIIAVGCVLWMLKYL